MPTLYVKCKTCGVKFKTGIGADEDTFKTMSLTNMHHKCPKGHENTYNKKDYSFE
jgi:hypothetical protein